MANTINSIFKGNFTISTFLFFLLFQLSLSTSGQAQTEVILTQAMRECMGVLAGGIFESTRQEMALSKSEQYDMSFCSTVNSQQSEEYDYTDDYKKFVLNQSNGQHAKSLGGKVRVKIFGGGYNQAANDQYQTINKDELDHFVKTHQREINTYYQHECGRNQHKRSLQTSSFLLTSTASSEILSAWNECIHSITNTKERSPDESLIAWAYDDAELDEFSVFISFKNSYNIALKNLSLCYDHRLLRLKNRKALFDDGGDVKKKNGTISGRCEMVSPSKKILRFQRISEDKKASTISINGALASGHQTATEVKIPALISKRKGADFIDDDKRPFFFLHFAGKNYYSDHGRYHVVLHPDVLNRAYIIDESNPSLIEAEQMYIQPYIKNRDLDFFLLVDPKQRLVYYYAMTDGIDAIEATNIEYTRPGWRWHAAIFKKNDQFIDFLKHNSEHYFVGVPLSLTHCGDW